jgi:hypothetical protein
VPDTTWPRSRPLPLLAILVAASLLAATAAPSTATEARVRALGGGADFLEDPTGVQRWAGSLVDYPQHATLELGRWHHEAADTVSRRGGGLHHRFDAAGRWGTAAIYFGEDLPRPDPGGWVRLIWARQFGPVSLGATFRGTSYSDADDGDELALTGESRYLHDLGLGLRWDVSDRLYLDLAAEALDAEVDYYDNQNGITREDLGGWDGFALRGRAFQRLGPTVVATGRVDWRRDTRPITDPVIGGLADLDADIFHGGLGFTILPDPDRLVIASVDYQRREDQRRATIPFHADWETTWRLWWRLDVRVGLEARLRPWLTVRAATGYRRTVDESLQRYRWSDDFTDSHYDYLITVDVPVALGVGLHLGDLDLDLTYGEAAPFAGGTAVIQQPAPERRTTTASLGYRF